jgi:hypothetical protein
VVQDCNSITGMWCAVPPCCSPSVYLFISPRLRLNRIVRLNRSWKLSAQSLIRHLNFSRKQSKANYRSSCSSPTFPSAKWMFPYMTKAKFSANFCCRLSHLPSFYHPRILGK